MTLIETIVLLLTLFIGLSVFSSRIRLPYPVILVLLGLAIGFVPGLPRVALTPDAVFLLFLPPLLYSAAWYTSWYDFKAAIRPIGLLAVGCVLFTTTAVATVAYWLIPGFTWGLGFLLGAIISPPDAVAATAITRRLGLAKRVTVILEGESLVNDASALVAYRYALAAIATGHFVLWEASLQFVYLAGGGVAVGLAIGWLLSEIHKLIKRNALVETSLSLVTPYIAYLLAERLHLSGILAIVTAGIYISYRSSETYSTQTRMYTRSLWDTLIFLLNGLIFILIGLQLPDILASLEGSSMAQAVLYGAIISLTVIVVRILWVFPGTYVPRMFKSIRDSEPDPDWRLVFVVAWTGMRGVVSLAAALALPVSLPGGQPFPHRNTILFVTFCVILATLVVQGISLPYVIRLLGIKPQDHESRKERDLRIKMVNAAIGYIEGNFPPGKVDDAVLAQVKNAYELKMNHLYGNIRAGQKSRDSGVQEVQAMFAQFVQAQKEMNLFERSLLLKMHKEGTMDEDIIRRLEYELDLEESRLDLEARLIEKA